MLTSQFEHLLMPPVPSFGWSPSLGISKSTTVSVFLSGFEDTMSSRYKASLGLTCCNPIGRACRLRIVCHFTSKRHPYHLLPFRWNCPKWGEYWASPQIGGDVSRKYPEKASTCPGTKDLHPIAPQTAKAGPVEPNQLCQFGSYFMKEFSKYINPHKI